MTTSNIIEIISHPRLAGNVRYTFLEMSNEERLSDIKILVPENMGADGLREGTYNLTDVFKAIAGDVATIEMSELDKERHKDNNADESLISDPSVSPKLILEETYQLLYMIAKTPWLKNAKIDVKNKQDGIFIQGKYSFVGAVQALGYLVEDAYITKYGEEEEDE